MAGNQRNANPSRQSSAHRPHVPIIPLGPGGRPVGPLPPSVHPLPGPFRAGLPVDVVKGPTVEISDVSHDLKTTNDMREDLTEYAIFRFEKMPMRNQYDDEGRLQLPTWDKAIRTRVPGMSPREISREIQHLNRNTRSLSDKLKSLSPVLQRQIDKAQEHLASQNSDPLNYHWVLVQLDHQLREIIPCVMVAGGNHSTSRRRYGSTKRRSHGRTGRHERKSYERISLRAYFKRTPRQNVDINMLWEAKASQINPVDRPHPHPHQPPHQQPHIQQQPQQQPQPQPQPELRAQRPGTIPTGTGAPFRPDGGRGLPPLNKPGMGNEANNAAAGNRGLGRGVERERARSHGNPNEYESDSDYSNYLSMGGSVDTPDTSQGSPSDGKNHTRGPSGHRISGMNKGGRYDSNLNGWRPPGGQQCYNAKDGRIIQPEILPRPPPPQPMVDIDKVREEAYTAGMRRGRDGARVSRERAYRQGKRPRPRPHIISGTQPPTLPYRRPMSTEGRRHQGDLSEEITRFNRLSLDEGDYDVRQRGEFEYFLHHGSVLEDDPFDREKPLYSRSGSRRYQGLYTSDDSESDFSLLERGKRRSRY